MKFTKLFRITAPIIALFFCAGLLIGQETKGTTAPVNISVLDSDPGSVIPYNSRSSDTLRIVWGGPEDPNSTFDGGFNDWTSVGLLCSPNAQGEQVADSLAQWEWRENPSSQGAFWGTRGPFESPTADNGAVIFDSDFLDNNGLPDNFGAGVCPSPQRAELISPVIDLTGEDAVVLSFHQYYRRFGGPGGSQAEVASFFEVSGDGGDSWTRIEVGGNSAIAVNGETENPTRTFIDISDVAGGSSEAMVKFVWDGDYYFWMIDDVEIIELPNNDVELIDAFYPPLSFTTPEAHIGTDTFGFSGTIRNNGGVTPDSILFSVEIRDIDSEELFHSETILIESLERGIDSFVVFENSFVPILEAGIYSIHYEVSVPGVDDFSPEDNFITYNFRVSEDIYAKDPATISTFTGGALPGGGTPEDAWWWGNFYYMSPDASDADRTFNEAQLALTAADGEFDTEEAQLWLIEVNNPGPLFDFSLINGAGLSGTPPSDHPEFTPIAFAFLDSDTWNGDDFTAGELYSVEASKFVDPSVFPPAPLEENFVMNPDKLYGLMVGMDSRNIRLPFFRGDFVYPASVGLLWSVGGDGAFTYFSGFTGIAGPIIRLKTGPTNFTEDFIGADGTFSVYPNPTSDQFTIDMDLDQMSDVKLNMYDVQGRLVMEKTYDNVTTQKLTENVGNFRSGTYVIEIKTDKETKKAPLIIVK